MKPAHEKIEEISKGVCHSCGTPIMILPIVEIKSLIIAELEELRGEEFQKTFQGTDGMSMKVYAYNSGMVDGYNESTHEHNDKIDKKIEELKEV